MEFGRNTNSCTTHQTLLVASPEMIERFFVGRPMQTSNPSIVPVSPQSPNTFYY